MKRILLLTILSVFVLISINLKSQGFIKNEPDCGQDRCGKIIGKIIDEKTNKLIDEEFYVIFCDCSKRDLGEIFFNPSKYMYKTKKGGEFSMMFPEGQYCLQFAPVKYDSIYEFDPYPTLNMEYEQKITVERGKITNVIKKVKRSGGLQIILTDENNNRINPMEVFNTDIKIEPELRSERVFPLIYPLYNPIDELGLNDGELIYYNLPPEIYELHITFGNMGYGSIEKKNIKINRETTTKLNIIIDKSNTTGIEGKVIDGNNNPLRDFNVKILKERNIKYLTSDMANIKTDEAGYFKIIGLKELVYELSVFGEIDGKTYYKKLGGIKIFKGKMRKKTIIVE